MTLPPPPQPVITAAAEMRPLATSTIPVVPFYSQFKNLTSVVWEKRGCGIASLAMILDYYLDQEIVPDKLLQHALSQNGYIPNVGWTYKSLIGVANSYGLTGEAFDLSATSTNAAYEQLSKALRDGPLIASVHYKFDPQSIIPHLVVINGIEEDAVYYSDPASTTGKVSLNQFLKAWKKRYIVIRPLSPNATSTIRT